MTSRKSLVSTTALRWSRVGQAGSVVRWHARPANYPAGGPQSIEKGGERPAAVPRLRKIFPASPKAQVRGLRTSAAP